MEPRRHGARKLLTYQSLLFNILPALHTKVDISDRGVFQTPQPVHPTADSEYHFGAKVASGF